MYYCKKNHEKECDGCMECSEAKPIYTCTECGAPIYQDDPYWEIGEKLLCEECVEEARRIA